MSQGKRQALADERGHDHAEREEQDEVARREVGRQGERRGQRHDAAHAGPRDDEHGPGGRIRVARPGDSALRNRGRYVAG